MQSVLDHVPVANNFTRPVASLAGCKLYEHDGALTLQLVTGKANRTASKWYHVQEIATQLDGRAFRLEPFSTDKLSTGEAAYVVLLAGPDTSCTCPGHVFTGGCKHVSALLHFQAEGRI